MKKVLIIAGTVGAALLVGIVCLLAYRARQSRICFKSTGQPAIAACTAYIENKGVLPPTEKRALARRSALYVLEKAPERALADSARALEIQLPDKSLQGKLDEAILGGRIAAAFAAKRFDISGQACDSLGSNTRGTRELSQACALSYFLVGRYADAAQDAWTYLGPANTDTNMLMLAALSSFFSGDQARARQALKRIDVSSLPPQSKVGVFLVQSDMVVQMGSLQEGLAILDPLLNQGQGLRNEDIYAIQERRYRILSLLGRMTEALPILDQILQIAPSPDERVSLLIRRGQGREALGRLIDAFSDFREAAEADPKRLSPHRGMGVVLAQKKRLSEAEAEFKTVLHMLKEGKDDPDSRLGAAYCSLLLHRDKRAAGDLMAKALGGDLKSLAHPKAFKLMLNALTHDPSLKTLAKTYAANIRTIPAGPVHPIDMKIYADELRRQVAERYLNITVPGTLQK